MRKLHLRLVESDPCFNPGLASSKGMLSPRYQIASTKETQSFGVKGFCVVT